MTDIRELDKQRAWIDIKKLRESRGWVQEETAEKLGVTRTHLSSIETGYRAISMKMMRRIIKVFGVGYDDFYKDYEGG